MRIVIASALMICLTAAVASAEPLPTQDEIHATFDQGQYQQALQKLNRVLILKGNAAKPYDRHDLLRLKGETQLRLKATAPAAQAFVDAAAATEDATTVAIDRATSLLIKRSQMGAYTPKSTEEKGKPKPQPIDILEPDSRKKALTALFDDEFAATSPKIKAVRNATQLSAIVDALPLCRDLRTLELAASSQDKQTKDLVAKLAGRARELMVDAVKERTPKVADIEKRANEVHAVDEISGDPKTGTPRTNRVYKKRGIDRNEGLTLQETVATCEKIGAASQELAEAFGLDSADFGPVRADAGVLGRKAAAVLNEDYSKSYGRPLK